MVVSSYGDSVDRPEFALPAIVCSSFAIELFLKFFISVEFAESEQSNVKPIKEHKITELWNMISDERQVLIVSMFRNKSGNPVVNGIERRKELFIEALDSLGQSPFIQWRYAHELKTSAFMSHASIVEVLDALGYSANYLIKEKKAHT